FLPRAPPGPVVGGLPVVPGHRGQRRDDHLGAGDRLQRELGIRPVLRGLDPRQAGRGVPVHPRLLPAQRDDDLRVPPPSLRAGEPGDGVDLLLRHAVMFLGWGALTLAFLVSQIDGGIGAIVHVAGGAGRLNVFNWGPAPGDSDFWHRILSDPNIVWVALLNGFVGSMAAFGTDHDLMQRLLTVETRRESQRTLALTPIGTLLTLLVYLGLGAGLYTFYTQHSAPALVRSDEILPHFVREAMPALLRGFM